MFGESNEVGWLTTVLILLFMFAVLGGFEMLLGWYAKAYDKTPSPIRKVFYVLFMVTGFYFAIKFI